MTFLHYSIKLELGDLEEADKILKRALEIETNVGFVGSDRHQTLMGLQELINRHREQVLILLAEPKPSFLSKLKPDTPLKITAYFTSFALLGYGVYYVYKKAHE